MEESCDFVTTETFPRALAVAKIKRSRIENLVSLRELAMQKIISYDVRIQSSPLLPHLPCNLKLEILDRMEAKGIEREKQLTMPAVKDLIFKMVNSLLDAKTKKFDFVIFSTYHKSDHQRDLDTWKLLVKKCPNLEKISDSRKHPAPLSYETNQVVKGVGKFKLQVVNTFLLQLPNLQHMLLEQYQCDEKDMAWIVQRFPNLITLGVSFNMVSPPLFASLFCLQRLEDLKIHWEARLCRKLSQEDRERQWNFLKNFGLECVKNLPQLRVCSIYPDYMSRILSHGQDLPDEDPRLPPLQLEHVSTNHFFDFRRTPYLRHVKFVGNILGDVSPAPCAFLTNLRVLEMLVELILKIEEEQVDVCDIFMLCPRLSKLKYDFGIYINETKPFNDQLDASHFQNLKEFSLDWRLSFAYASQLMALVLTAPLLECLIMWNSFTMTPEVCNRLHRPLIKGKILQQLKKFKFGSHLEQPAELLQFLLLLPVHAPRLEKMVCYGANASFKKQIQESPLQDLNAIDHFEYTESRIVRENYVDEIDG
ncbi:uncharacterized protein LOC132194753 [Neocloeon triangulifer]|uniref:uncharacterized protein LOC132194753 n=1 Tax=Neocloeon triangulifer TaxID=2078957 RepID=UPI00286FA2B5|nr:uncharacterized protein LOC132194753 [Neocloeon triangulifer]